MLGGPRMRSVSLETPHGSCTVIVCSVGLALNVPVAVSNSAFPLANLEIETKLSRQPSLTTWKVVVAMLPFFTVDSRNAHNGAAFDVASAPAAPIAAMITTATRAAGLHPRKIIDSPPCRFRKFAQTLDWIDTKSTRLRPGKTARSASLRDRRYEPESGGVWPFWTIPTTRRT